MTVISRFRWNKSGDELSSPELVRECGRRLTDPNLWRKFQERFQKNIATYVIRTIRMRQDRADPDLVCDLVQDVYVRLIENKGRALSAFRGETDFSVLAFLGRMTMGVVSDYYRSQQAWKRQAEIVPIEEVRRAEEKGRLADQDLDVSSILSWIDVDRLMDTDSDRKKAARNVLIFKLHYIDGFTAREIAQYPGYEMTERAVELILQNMRLQLKRRLGR